MYIDSRYCCIYRAVHTYCCTGADACPVKVLIYTPIDTENNNHIGNLHDIVMNPLLINWERERHITGCISGWATSRELYRITRCQILKSSVLSLELSVHHEIHSGHRGSVHCIAVDDVESRYVLSGGNDAKICLYDLESKQLSDSTAQQSDSGSLPTIVSPPICSTTRSSSTGHEFSVTSVFWYPNDSGAFISSACDGKVLVWDTDLYEIAGCFQLNSKVYSASMHTDGVNSLVLCATADKGIRLCDLSSGDCAHILGNPSDCVYSASWCPNNEYHVASGNQDGRVQIFDIRRAGHHAVLMSFDSQQDHTHFISRSTYQTVNWNRHAAAQAHSRDVISVKYSPSGQHLISFGSDGKIRLWEAATGYLHPIQYSPARKSKMSYYIDVFDYTNEGAGSELLAYPDCEGNILLTPMHSSTGQPVHILRGHLDVVNGTQLLPTGRAISCGRDGMIFLWAPPVDSEVLERASNHGKSTVDAWSDSDNDSTEDGNNNRRSFVPAILDMYRQDIRSR